MRGCIAELEKRGFPSMLVRSSVSGSDTPNEDRASAIVKALEDVTDHVVLVGISNQGNFLPLAAVRRVVYVNALIPRPGELAQNSNATEAQRKAMRERIDASSAAHTLVGFYEICPLKMLPKVQNVQVSGSADGQIRPAWEQSAALGSFGVEPVVISGAGHANLFSNKRYAAQLADACVRDL